MCDRREFFIASEMNGKVLDVKGGEAKPGAEVIMWNKHSNKAKNQLWYADAQGYIHSSLKDYALDARTCCQQCPL